MAMNRIQFQPGLSLSSFLTLFSTEAQCEAALEKDRWPQGFLTMRSTSTSTERAIWARSPIASTAASTWLRSHCACSRLPPPWGHVQDLGSVWLKNLPNQ